MLNLLLATLLLAGGVAEVKTGGVQMVELSNGYKVWTKRVRGGGVPVLTLHGGPGCTHEYFECMEDFLPGQGFDLIYYDQLGSYYSDQPEDSSLWVLERFVDEVEQVRRALGIEHFYLYGQSWGGLLAIEYALKHQDHLKGLILSNMTASIDSYEAHLAALRKEFPQEIQETLKKYEDVDDFFAPEYVQLMDEVIYKKHLCRLENWPEPVTRMVKHVNPVIYNTMQGPNEFIFIGNLKGWDRWADIHKITVPTLVMGAKYDTMNPEDIEKMGRLIPHAKVSMCANGSHLALYDDQEAYFRDLISFLKEVEASGLQSH